MDTQRQLLCLLLHAQPRLGARTTGLLLDKFKTAPDFWSAPRSALPKAKTPASDSLLLALWREGESAVAWQQAKAWHAGLSEGGISMLEVDSPDYPPLLREIPDRPRVLYAAGDTAHLVLPHLAVVGSRSAGHSSLALAESLAADIAGCGLCICSGMALGVDGAAHRGALRAAGRTVAVLGTGIDRVYPARHASLAMEIRNEGVLLSEFPPGAPPLPTHFPKRNRIIAGMSVGTLVVEAAARSGSLITARLALDYNRDVFALPGSVHDPACKGNHELIRQGAKLVETTSHVIEELGAWLELLGGEKAGPADADPAPVQLVPHLDKVLRLIDFAPTTLDTILSRSGLSPSSLSEYLLELELSRWVECNAGTYRRCR